MSTKLSTPKGRILISSPYYLKQREFEEQIISGLQKAGIIHLDAVQDSSLVFDLSGSYYHDLGTLLWFISLLHKLRKNRNELQIILPSIEREDDPKGKGERVWDFLIRWKFFQALYDCVDEPVNLLLPEQVALMIKPSRYTKAKGKDELGQETTLNTLKVLEITTLRSLVEYSIDKTVIATMMQKYQDIIMISALKQLCRWEPTEARIFIQRILNEGVYNSLLHSKGSFANISMKIDDKNLTLVVSDNGIGIPNVLRTAFKQKGTDAELIKYFTEPEMLLDSQLIKLATKKGTTSIPQSKGQGLFYLKSIVLSQGGELRIRSGEACVDFTESKIVDYNNMLESPGTMMRVQTPLRGC